MKKLTRIMGLIFTITLLAGCSRNVPAAPAPTPLHATTAALIATPTAKTISPDSPEAKQQATVTEFIASQDGRVWDRFVELWTAEEQLYYRNFFAFSENETDRNGYFAIQSAKLTDTYEIKDFAKLLKDNQAWNLPVDIWSLFDRNDVLEQYGDVRLWIAKADYELNKEFWDYRNGVNYRMLVLVPEDGAWKVTQDYQGYPGAGMYFGDIIQQPEETEESIPSETPNTLADGTVHYTDSAIGYFIGTETGDYVHPGIRTIEGEELWFWMGEGCDIDLDTLSYYQKIQVTWENRDKYIDEADEVINMDAITDIEILD